LHVKKIRLIYDWQSPNNNIEVDIINIKEILLMLEKTYGLKMKVKDRMIATEFYNKVKIFIS